MRRIWGGVTVCIWSLRGLKSRIQRVSDGRYLNRDSFGEIGSRNPMPAVGVQLLDQSIEYRSLRASLRLKNVMTLTSRSPRPAVEGVGEPNGVFDQSESLCGSTLLA